jgi:dihydroorotase
VHDLLLVNGSVMTVNGVQTVDLAITDGLIDAMGNDLAGQAVRTIDCKGAWVGPGFVDVHTHLREPGQDWKEDIASGTAAAAAGGYTAVVAMPNTVPPVDTGQRARHVVDVGQRAGHTLVASAGCLTVGRAGEEMTDIGDMWDAGVRVFSDDGDALQNAGLLRLVMERVGELGGVISQHAVDAGLSSTGHMHEGTVSTDLNLQGIPREADNVLIARDIALAKLTGVRYHVQHLSTGEAVSMIADAKADGVHITAEATPHHLMFTDEDVRSLNTRFKMMPPLRLASDRQALVDGLRSGVIDVVATDHAPHSPAEKEVPFPDAANGVTGLEWAAAVVNGVVGMDQMDFFNRMSITPARIAMLDGHGEPLSVGAAANVVVFDPETTWIPSSTVSKSLNSPYLGRDLRGRVLTTILDGQITYGV